MFGGTIVVAYWFAGVTPQNPVHGGLLVFLECLIALSVTFMFGTWFSTLTNGVIVLGLHGLAFMGGWLEQMSGFTEGSRIAMVGILSSLVMPTEAVWRRAAFEMESPLAGSLPQFALLLRRFLAQPGDDRLRGIFPARRSSHRHLAFSAPRPLSPAHSLLAAISVYIITLTGATHIPRLPSAARAPIATPRVRGPI